MTLSVKKTMILKSIMAVVIVTCMFQQQIADGSANNQDSFDLEIAIAKTIQDSTEFEVTGGFSHIYNKIGNWSDSGSVHKVIVEDDYAYVADGSNGFRILDVSNISDITQVGFYRPNAAICYDLALDSDNDRVYLAYGTNGFVILDIETKSSPNLVHTSGLVYNDFLIGTNQTLAIDIDEHYAYLACGYQGLVLVSFVNEETPARIGNGYNNGEYARDIVKKQHGSEEYAFITFRNWGLGIISVGNPVNPSLTGSYLTATTELSDPFGLEVDFEDSARYVYLADQNGFFIISVWTPANPSCGSGSYVRYHIGSIASSVSLAGNKAFVTYQNEGLRIFNITDRSVPDIDGIVGTFDDGNDGTNYNLGTFVLDEYCYYADGDDGLKVVELDSDKDRLYDGDEINVYLTDETDDDSDDDEINDGDEVFDYLTDPNNPDSDEDFIFDGEEIIVGIDGYITNPLNNDTDNDGLKDGNETLGLYYPTSPNANSTGYIFTDPTNADTDNDGLTDGDEYLTHLTDPTVIDTDEDGMDDEFEVTYDLNPLLDDSASDKDGDGVSNIDEYNYLPHHLNPNNPDTDADSLTDGEELYGIYWPTNPYVNGTGYITTNKPLNSDSDGDGLKDGFEVKLYYSNPLDTDSDGDGLDDYEEVIIYSTFANSSDTDGDSLGDFWEVTWGTNPLRNDIGDDNDTDGLTHLEEYNLGTDPMVADTDGDGMPDGYEVEQGFNPLVADGHLDTDGDGLTNAEEYEIGTDPHLTDTDGDGIDDKWEVDSGTDPFVNDASEDPDGDGLTNAEEYAADTDPFDEDSDNDTLSDYDEINIYGTNPNKYDSDSDSYSDAEEINAGSDPLDPNSTPVSRRNLLILSISLSIAMLLIAVLVIFLLTYRFTRPEQRMFRYIESQRAEGKVSLSTKEITQHLDKKLNKGQIKQLAVEHSQDYNLTLTGNTIWLSSEENLEDNIQIYKEETSSFRNEKPSATKISALEKKIITDRKVASKLKLTKLDKKYSALLADLEEISSIKQFEVSPLPPEPEIVEESSTETFSMPDISSTSADEIQEEVVDPEQSDD